MCHCIRKTLNIKDENITFDENYLTEEKYRNVLALVFNGTLAPKTPNSCPKVWNHQYKLYNHQAWIENYEYTDAKSFQSTCHSPIEEATIFV